MPPLHEPEAEPMPFAKKLAGRIAANGPIPFHNFMEACLYDSGHGYYIKKDPLGGRGDFITAPEISQVFGELAGLWAGEAWHLMGRPNPIRLIELGPGRGTLMADALRALRVLPDFLKNVTVHLIEMSPALRGAQQTALAGAPCPMSWHDRMAEVPRGASIVIANEFLDCLPVRQFVFDGAAGLWRERMVAFEDGCFRLAMSSNSVEVPPRPGLIEGSSGVLAPHGERDRVRGDALIADGAILEVRPGVAGTLGEFAARAADAPFAALIFDYGYSRPSFGDTVQAVKQHRFAGIFDAPGEADLTAHVDFHDLICKANELNLCASGPMPMGEWLLRMGLETRVRQLLSRASTEEAIEIRSRVSRLVDPSQMGVLFKAAALTGDRLGPLPPFC